MDCQFSETQFAFCVLNELVAKLNPAHGWSMPIMPTQRAEALSGYDCQLKGSVRTLFLQFKVPRMLLRTNAKYWSSHNQPYFQFKIWPDPPCKQHNTLVDLAKKDPRNQVFYCSPAFVEQTVFNTFYTRGQVLQNSIFVSCASLSYTGFKERHSISYTLNPRRSVMHSEPVEVECLSLERLLPLVQDGYSYGSLEECVSSLAQQLELDETAVPFQWQPEPEDRQFSDYPFHGDNIPRREDPTQSKLLQVASTLLAQYGAHLVLF